MFQRQIIAAKFIKTVAKIFKYQHFIATQKHFFTFQQSQVY